MQSTIDNQYGFMESCKSCIKFLMHNKCPNIAGVHLQHFVHISTALPPVIAFPGKSTVEYMHGPIIY